MEKNHLRKSVLSRRSAYSTVTLHSLSTKIQSTVIDLPYFENSQILSSYVGMTGEVETRDIISTALGRGKTVMVPKTLLERNELVFSRLLDMEKDLASGYFGILEPRKECIRPLALDEADLVIVPAVAWDTRGYRLGYGKGYYDKALARVNKSATLIGLGFEFQLLERIPEEKHDIPVYMIVTEERIIKCG